MASRQARYLCNWKFSFLCNWAALKLSCANYIRSSERYNVDCIVSFYVKLIPLIRWNPCIESVTQTSHLKCPIFQIFARNFLQNSWTQCSLTNSLSRRVIICLFFEFGELEKIFVNAASILTFQMSELKNFSSLDLVFEIRPLQSLDSSLDFRVWEIEANAEKLPWKMGSTELSR